MTPLDHLKRGNMRIAICVLLLSVGMRGQDVMKLCPTGDPSPVPSFKSGDPCVAKPAAKKPAPKLDYDPSALATDATVTVTMPVPTNLQMDCDRSEYREICGKHHGWVTIPLDSKHIKIDPEEPAPKEAKQTQ